MMRSTTPNENQAKIFDVDKEKQEDFEKEKQEDIYATY
jgi:hypothetical protein